jgi:putative ABC transport system permease protein
MLKNYIVVAIRLLLKNKLFSFINILGLSTGIACCVLITLYVQDEFNYEKGVTDNERIFRVNTVWINEDGSQRKAAQTSPSIATDIAHDLPGVEMATRAIRPLSTEQNIVRYADKTFFEQNAFVVDSNFFSVFQFPFVQGDRLSALNAPSTVVLSEVLSEKIFGNKNPIDESLIVHSGQSADTFRVTGVVAKPAFPSHLDADLYMTMQSNGTGQWVLGQTTWANNNMVGGYLKLKNPLEAKALEAKLPAEVDRRAGEELRASGRKKSLSLQPLLEIRLYSEGMNGEGSSTGGSITYIKIIGIVGLFILLLACINFMNLTTAKSAQRASEVGIRKSMGAYKSNLVGQFLGESMVIVACSFCVSIFFVFAALPVFNNVMQKQLAFTAHNIPLLLICSFVICVITGILAGSYPAFFLSAMKPTQVLKGKSLSSDGSQWLRKSLVVFQFVITITLISSIVIIKQQLSFMQNKSLGFNTDQVIMIPMRTSDASAQYATLKTSFEQLSGVNIVSASSSIPSTPLNTDWGIYKEGANSDQTVFHDIVRVDRDYFKSLDIKLIAGRDFDIEKDNLATDTIGPSKGIVNEASLKELGIPVEKAVGSSIYFQPGTERYEFVIIGVVKDFHQFSLHREIRPMLCFLPSSRNGFRFMAVNLNMNSYEQLQSQMKKIWDERIHSVPIETVFLNENVKNLYQAERRTSTLLTISTVIALIISCLGLYGLSVYVAERKTKEIGIRKVIGATSRSIVQMLSVEYIKLIVISFIISIPLGYYAMEKWLESYAYRISPGLLVFIISGVISFLLAWLTISVESFRAANRNPVETLRNS